MSASLKETLARFHNEAYWQCATKCQDTVHKLDRGMNYLGRGMDTYEREEEFLFDGAPMETAAEWCQASSDIPYHLDSLLSYLRIMADCIAFAIPFFYRTKESIANRSFRDHRKWFLEKKPEFDSEYAGLLREKTAWFDKLAGQNPKGIRDLQVHQLGTYQLGLTHYSTGERTILVQQVTANGMTDPDLTFTIAEIMAGFFGYLDGVYLLFGDRLRNECPALVTRSLEEESVYMRYFGIQDLRRRYRLYPLIDTINSDTCAVTPRDL